MSGLLWVLSPGAGEEAGKSVRAEGIGFRGS